MRKHAFLIGFLVVVAAIVAVALSVRSPEQPETQTVAQAPVAEEPAVVPTPPPAEAPAPTAEGMPALPAEPLAVPQPPVTEEAEPSTDEVKEKATAKRSRRNRSAEVASGDRRVRVEPEEEPEVMSDAESAEPAEPGEVEVTEEPVAEAPAPAPTEETIAAAKEEVERELAILAPETPRYGGELVFTERVGWVRPEAVDVRVDGRPLTGARDWQAIRTGAPIRIDDLPFGTHKIDVSVRLVGDSNAFSYMKGYTFTLHRGAIINVTGPSRITIEAEPKNRLAADWKDRMQLEINLAPL